MSKFKPILSTMVVMFYIVGVLSMFGVNFAVADNSGSESVIARNWIKVYNQGDYSQEAGSYGRDDGSIYKSACGMFCINHAMQWVGLNTPTPDSMAITDKNRNCYGFDYHYFENSASTYGYNAENLYGSSQNLDSFRNKIREVFNAGGAITLHVAGSNAFWGSTGGHYCLGIGISQDGNKIHIVDSSALSTIGVLFSSSYNGYYYQNGSFVTMNKSWDKYTTRRTLNLKDADIVGGEYWVDIAFIRSMQNSEGWTYAISNPNGNSHGGGFGYSWNTPYYENSTYRVTKAFNWRNGPSSTADVVGSASVGDTFQTESAIWNTTTNNMWVKVRGEEKYVFAGYKWDGSKWFLDTTQNQYLQFVSDNATVDWPGCNVGGSHPKGNKLAVLGTITCSNNMVSVQGEFYNGASCWGNPTSKYSASGTSYYVPSSGLDYGLSFSTLPASNSLKLVVTVEYLYNRGQNTGSKTYEVGFSVTDGGTTPPSDDTSTINKTYRIKSTTTWGLNVRSVPTTSNNDPIGLLNPGDTIVCTKRTNYQANGYYWLYGTSNSGITGWISENMDWIEEVTSTPTTAYLDVNGWLDGVYDGGLNGYGTVDVYVNGNKQADDVGDYYASWPVGTSYEIKDIKACTGYIYTGVHEGSVSGTIGNSGTSVVLGFNRDTTAPTISNIQVSNITPSGYTVTCNVSDNVGVTRVSFLAWTEENWQDDMIGHDASLFGNTASFTVNVSDHNNENGCTYYMFIYAYDAVGNRAVDESTSVFVPSPTIFVSSISLNPSKLSITKGNSAALTATVLPANATNTSVTWSSNNTNVATVTGGVVKAVGVGNATITCTAADGNGATATCAVTVPEEVIPDFILPSALKEIGEEAFAGIAARRVVVPDGVKTIGKKAFADCLKLEQITIPASTTTIAMDAFTNAPSGFTIYGPLNSYAQTFASENGIRFVADDACTITFNANSGVSSETSRTIKKGTAIGTLPTASKSNNAFDGWYTLASGGTKVTASTVFSDDTTVYAHWTQQTCTITFDANGDSCNTSTKVINKGEAIGSLPTPTRTYYSFKGWYTQQSGGSAITASTTFSQDQTLYARWELNGFGNWSEWSTTPVTGNDNREVQSEVRSVQTGSKTKYNYRRYIYWNSSAGQWWATYAEYGSNGQWQYATSDSPFTPDGVRDGNQRYNGERRDGTPYWYFETITSEPIYSDVTYYRYRDRIQ